ncbi:hypothetical protein PACTADRAFT_3857 [Pachysolen tannophilus NRRL Y-2460]|uniref:F-box domain-containing protein n=1 Tax=Pachysolen tannophilus NRRL Y-2460 TaxID=669874 RepID=A0A1E4TTA1_PACTA|nr:hypothetical protein PACTADRAFT_3857 [Pachysolen tannophilus NRRL Y-2460]
MGFLNPGSATWLKKKPKTKSKEKLISKNSVVRVRVQRNVKDKKNSLKFNYNILELLPVELIHKIFIYSECSNLPLVNKHFHNVINKHNNFLINKIIKSNIYCINNKNQEFALNIELLNYKFINYEILFKFSQEFNIILLIKDLNLIKEEEEYLEKKIGFNKNLDFPKKFKKGPFTIEKIKLIKFLSLRNLKFEKIDQVLIEAFKFNTSLSTITDLISASNTPMGKLKSLIPLIDSLNNSNFNISKYLIKNHYEFESIFNNEYLWEFVVNSKNIKILTFLEEQGFKPNHNVIDSIIK